MRALSSFAVTLMTLLWTSMAWAQSAPADFTVVSTTAPTLRAGQTLSKGTPIDLPDKTEVTLTDRTSGKVVQRMCTGIYKGPVEACTRNSGCSAIDRLLGKCKGSGSETGGVEAGGTRDIPRPSN